MLALARGLVVMAARDVDGGTALVVATRAAERRSCPRNRPSPQFRARGGDEARGAAGERGAGHVRGPTGTERSSSGDAAGTSV